MQPFKLDENNVLFLFMGLGAICVFLLLMKLAIEFIKLVYKYFTSQQKPNLQAQEVNIPRLDIDEVVEEPISRVEEVPTEEELDIADPEYQRGANENER